MPEQRITSIEVQEKRGNRRSIFIDGRFALGVDESVIADLGLRVGQAIDEEQLQAAVRKELLSKSRERTLLLLDYRQRSKVEVARRLHTAGFSDDIIEETILSLEKLGFLNDAEFSRTWVNHRLSEKGMGKARMKWELRQKGVSDEVAQEALASLDNDTDYESAIVLARRKWEKDSSTDERGKRRRLTGFLQRKGFRWDTVSKVLSELSGNPDQE